jgi:hypothetical protein
MLETADEYMEKPPSDFERRLELLREMVKDYGSNEIVDIAAPYFLWPVLSPLEVGLTAYLGRELGPTPRHRMPEWDESYAWVIEAVKKIYPVWFQIEEEFGPGSMLNIENREIADAISRPAGAVFIGLARIENARKLRSVKGRAWYRRALEFRFETL